MAARSPPLRKPLLAGVAACLLLSAPVWMAVVPPHPSPVTKAAYDRVQTGMNRAEVEAILGGPPGDDRTRPTDSVADTWPEPEQWKPTGHTAWRGDWLGDEGDILVVRDHGGRVFDKGFFEAEPVGGTLALLRWRLNRRWDRVWGGP